MTTRRKVIAGIAFALGGAAINPSCVVAAGPDDVSRTAEAIHQEVVFEVIPKRVYEVLTETRQFDKVIQLSGAMQAMSLGSTPTQISREVGGTFTIFGGHIIGRHLELLPGERIVQAWRVVDWEPGVYTKLVFDHTGFPVGQGEHLSAGWKANYWMPLKKFLASA
jgi:activator of HSP90 ATPase